MINHKIVLSGPVGAGKTTAIRSVSDEPPLATDFTATDAARARKKLTTVALDHGAFYLDDGERVHLYGTPGQDRFDFMWEILSHGATGLVLLIPNDHHDPLTELRSFVRAFTPLLTDRVGAVVGVTHTDRSDLPTLDDYRQALAGLDLPHVPVLAVDARSADDVRRLVLSLIPEHHRRAAMRAPTVEAPQARQGGIP